MAGKGSAPGERRGGRQAGVPNVLPDLRAMTLKALMKAGGIDYLAAQAVANPGPFLGLLGKVLPREVNMELSGELKIRAEVRRDLVEKLVVLMAVPHEPEGSESKPLPAITHEPQAMLKAQRHAERESLSRRAVNARDEGASAVAGAVERAAAMQVERTVEG